MSVTTIQLRVPENDRRVLERWSAENAQYGIGLHAAVVLLAAAGTPRAEIARRLVTTRPTVSTWIRRYEQEGLAGLHDRARPGRRRNLEDTEIILRTLATRPSDLPYRSWSSRSLGDQLQVSNGTIARVWRRWRLRPGETNDFRLPTVPVTQGRIVDVAGMFQSGGHAMLALRVTDRPAAPRPPGEPFPVPSGVRELCGALDAAAARCDVAGAAPPPGSAASDGHLSGFLARLESRHPGVQLCLAVSCPETALRPALRDWSTSCQHTLHVVRSCPTWPELVAVAVGSVLARHAGALSMQVGTGVLDAMRALAGAYEDLWWVGGVPARPAAATSMPTV